MKRALPAVLCPALVFGAGMAPLSAGKIPTFETQQERADPGYGSDSSPSGFVESVGSLGQSIGRQGSQSSPTAGLDFFVRSLERVLKKGNDVPRDNILKNAVKARSTLKTAYESLKEAASKLLEGRDTLEQVDPELRQTVDQLKESVDRLKDVLDKMKETVDGIEPDPPEAKGKGADVGKLDDNQDMEDRIGSLDQAVDQAGQKLGEAKDFVDKAKPLAERVRSLGSKAGELDRAAADRLSQGRTLGKSRKVSSKLNSRKAIMSAHKSLADALSKAEKAVGALERLTQQGQGYKKALDDARKANEDIQDATKTGQDSGKKVNQSNKKVQGPIKQQYQQAEAEQDESGKQEAVSQAQQEKGKAESAQKKFNDPVQKSEGSSGAMDSSAMSARSGLDDFERALGSDADGLRELPELQVKVPPPAQAPGRAYEGARPRKLESKPLRWPKVLDDPASRVMQEYGEGSYAQAD